MVGTEAAVGVMYAYQCYCLSFHAEEEELPQAQQKLHMEDED